MSAKLSVFAILLLTAACGGRTLLDDPNDELPLPDGGPVPINVVDSGSNHDSGTTKSDGGGSGTGGECGGQTCTASEDCCGNAALDAGFSAANASLSCVPKGTCKGLVAACGSAADCSGGDVCCASLGGGGSGSISVGGFNISVSCDKTCPSGGFQLCAKDSECKAGVTCQSTMFGASLCGGLGALGGAFGGGGGGGLGGLGGH
jgi:hypothetical protein